MTDTENADVVSVFLDARDKHAQSQDIQTAKRLYQAADALILSGGQADAHLCLAWKAKEDTFAMRKRAINVDPPGMVYSPIFLHMSANQLVSVLNELEGALLQTATPERRKRYYQSDVRFVVDTIRDIIANCRMKHDARLKSYRQLRTDLTEPRNREFA